LKESWESRLENNKNFKTGQEEKFGIEKMRQMDAFTSVAYGLGISASMDFE